MHDNELDPFPYVGPCTFVSRQSFREFPSNDFDQTMKGRQGQIEGTNDIADGLRELRYGSRM